MLWHFVSLVRSIDKNIKESGGPQSSYLLKETMAACSLIFPDFRASSRLFPAPRLALTKTR
jgi:hypothetical protein